MKMEGKSTPVCEWHNCEQRAQKHIGFGRRVFHSVQLTFALGHSVQLEHLALCETHIAEIRQTYLEVNEHDLAASY